MNGCTATTQLATSLWVHDRRTRYRRRKSGPAPRSSRDDSSSAPAQRQAPADARPQAYDVSARWQRITELNARLSAKLDDEGRALWRALEEALHVHWLDVAVNHYNRGYAAGRAQSWVDETLADVDTVQDQLRAIALALEQVIAAFEVPGRSS